MITYKYIEIDRGKIKVKLPMIPIIIKGDNDKIFRTDGLLDSGADSTCISKSVAELLGLDLSAEPETMGVAGGTEKYTPSKATIQLNNSRYKFNRRFDVCIIPDNHDAVPVILGRHPFFEHFEIRFLQNKLRIQLKPNNKT